MKKELKDIFQKHYAETSTPVDVEQLFKAIEAKRSPKKIRRWLFLLPIGFLGAILFYAALSSSTEGQLSKNSIVLDSKESKESNDQSSELVEYQLSKSQNKVQASESESEKSSIPIASTEIIKNKNLNKTAISFSSASKQTKKNLVKELQTSSEAKVSQALYDKPAVAKASTRQAENPVSDQPENKLTNGIDFSKSILSIESKASVGAFVKIDKIYSSILMEDRPKISLSRVPTVEQKAALEYESNKSLRLKVIAGGPLYTETRSTLSSGNQMIVDGLDTATKPFSSLECNVLLEYPVTRRISISSGLSYTRMSELFEWKGTYVADANRNYVADSNPQEVKYSLVGISTEQHYFEHIGRDVLKYNKRHLIDIPLALSYRVLDKKLKTDLYIGAAFNVFYQIKGYTLTQDIVPAKMEGDEKVATEWNLGLEFGYELTSAFSALLRTELATRKITNPYFDQRVLTPSLKVGVAYSF